MYQKLLFVIIVFIFIYFLFKYSVFLIYVRKKKKQISTINEIINNTQQTKVRGNYIKTSLFENVIELNICLEKTRTQINQNNLLFKISCVFEVIICLYRLIVSVDNKIYIIIAQLIIGLIIGFSILVYHKLNMYLKEYIQMLDLVNIFFESINLRIDISSRCIIPSTNIIGSNSKSSNSEIINLIKEYNHKGEKNKNDHK